MAPWAESREELIRSSCHTGGWEKDERHWPEIQGQSRRMVSGKSKERMRIPRKEMMLVHDVNFKRISDFTIFPERNAFLKLLKLRVLVLFYIYHVSTQSLQSMSLNCCICLLICKIDTCCHHFMGCWGDLRRL